MSKPKKQTKPQSPAKEKKPAKEAPYDRLLRKLREGNDSKSQPTNLKGEQR